MVVARALDSCFFFSTWLNDSIRPQEALEAIDQSRRDFSKGKQQLRDTDQASKGISISFGDGILVLVVPVYP